MRKAATVIFVIALLAWLAYHATGSRFGGDATTPSDIPIVGENLSELEFIEPANFRGYEHPHGGGTFTITGTATQDSIVRFCDSAEVSLSQDGTEIAERDDILAYLKDREVKLPEFTPDHSPEVLFGYGGRFPKLYGVYDAATNRFVISLQFYGSK
ncbi:hypothetical protein Enr13x_09570 [Stieleria neptunia]|uniref:Uncharacterized protein n=1 Tax=Stieleria neptunia TaxID=2527979 RepID=A0A518HJX0_9BACT|nr:hypothetical protein [Stieleria neptunia]QDV41119.1 hypothetical protein Enr13x_09570 [Stieleria neptunia]